MDESLPDYIPMFLNTLLPPACKMVLQALALVVLALQLSACTSQIPSSPAPASMLGLANPAAVACVKAGGTHEIVRNEDKSESGMCRLPSGKVCDAWAYFRSQCSP